MSQAAPTFIVETISPDLAQTYLEANIRNRPASRSVVQNYAVAIALGEWQMNAEAIKFDWNGNLVDGQHRLMAIVKAGEPIDVLVARNLNPDAFTTIDTGKVRSGGDVLAMRGVYYSGAVAGAYRSLHRFLDKKGLTEKSRVSNSRVVELHETYPNLVDLAYEAMREPMYTPLIAPAARIFFYWQIATIGQAAAREFMIQLGSGAVEKTAATALRDRLIETNEEVIKPAINVKRAWLTIAWNDFLRGDIPERFPRVFDQLPVFERFPISSRLSALQQVREQAA